MKQQYLPNFSIKDFISKVKKYSDNNFTVHAYCGCEDSDIFRISLNNLTSDLPNITPLKIVCQFSTAQQADDFKKFALNEKTFKNCYVSKSWNVGVEFNSLSATKGTAIDFIKNHLKDIHTSIGVGDYENDIPLISHADIGICVNNAVNDVKKVSDYVTVNNEQHAIERIINEIDNGILKI